MTFGPSCSLWQLLTSIILKCIFVLTCVNCNHLGEMMPMLPYPPSTKPNAAENSLLRVLGGVLAFLSILLALLGILVHQRVPDLLLAIIVGIFALRVLILWLGHKPQPQQPIPVWVRYPMQSSPSPQGQPAPYASPSSQSQPLYQMAPEHHMQQTVPLPPTAVAPPSPKLPRSVRPQWPPKAQAFPAQPAPLPQGVQPIPPSQPPSLGLPPPYTSVPMPSPAPVPRPSQQGNWQYDDGKNCTQQRGNDHGTA